MSSKKKPRRRRRPGRPTVLTPEAIDAIALLVEAGHSPHAACGTLFHPESYRYWWDKGNAAEEYVQAHADELESDEDGLLHHPDPDQDLYLTFARRLARAATVAYGTAEARLKDKNPLDWLTGPSGRSVALLLGMEPYSRRPNVDVNVMTVPDIVDQSFKVLEEAGEPVGRLGDLEDLKKLPIPMLGVDPRGPSDSAQPAG